MNQSHLTVCKKITMLPSREVKTSPSAGVAIYTYSGLALFNPMLRIRFFIISGSKIPHSCFEAGSESSTFGQGMVKIYYFLTLGRKYHIPARRKQECGIFCLGVIKNSIRFTGGKLASPHLVFATLFFLPSCVIYCNWILLHVSRCVSPYWNTVCTRVADFGLFASWIPKFRRVFGLDQSQFRKHVGISDLIGVNSGNTSDFRTRWESIPKTQNILILLNLLTRFLFI